LNKLAAREVGDYIKFYFARERTVHLTKWIGIGAGRCPKPDLPLLTCLSQGLFVEDQPNRWKSPDY